MTRAQYQKKVNESVSASIDELTDFLIQSNIDIYYAIRNEDFEKAANTRDVINNTIDYYAEAISNMTGNPKEIALELLNKNNDHIRLELEEKGEMYLPSDLPSDNLK